VVTNIISDGKARLQPIDQRDQRVDLSDDTALLLEWRNENVKLVLLLNRNEVARRLSLHLVCLLAECVRQQHYTEKRCKNYGRIRPIVSRLRREHAVAIA